MSKTAPNPAVQPAAAAAAAADQPASTAAAAADQPASTAAAASADQPATQAAAAPGAELAASDTALAGAQAMATEYPAHPDMPKIGSRVLLTALFGRMVHPEKPEAENELDVDKMTRATFDWWHANLWRAGRIKLAEV